MKREHSIPTYLFDLTLVFHLRPGQAVLTTTETLTTAIQSEIISDESLSRPNLSLGDYL